MPLITVKYNYYIMDIQMNIFNIIIEMCYCTTDLDKLVNSAVTTRILSVVIH